MRSLPQTRQLYPSTSFKATEYPIEPTTGACARNTKQDNPLSDPRVLLLSPIVVTLYLLAIHGTPLR
jgi:hypothetical protein